MVPGEYRLENVVGRLIERLEAARPSHIDADADVALRRIAESHLLAVIAEMRDIGLVDQPDAHARFLRDEVLGTFLPRYTRLARQHSALELRHYGVGQLAEPVGRIGLVAVSLLILWFMLRLIAIPMAWPLLLFALTIPFWPDLAARIARRRYAAELLAVVDDMSRIQEQAVYWLPPSVVEGTSQGAQRPDRRQLE